MFKPLHRRQFIQSGLSLAALSTGLAQIASAAEPAKKLPRVAAINSVYRLRSHAYHIAGRFIYGYTRNGFHHQPPFQLVRMYNDQSPKGDLGPEVCERHDIQLCKTVSEALVDKSGKLDVDAVLLIIEHGDYPVNDLGQTLYPRYEMFEQIVDVFEKRGRSVPVFVDKHLSYDHRQAAKMVETAKKLKFGLMAGSSLPVTWRLPEIEPPLETPFTEGLAIFGFDRGNAEIYFIHALEVLQCMLERRKGGETGVKSVVCLEGDAVWKSGDEGRWSWKLLEAAVARCPSSNYGKTRENVKHPQAILVEYIDGTRGAAINLIEQVSDFAFAGFEKGRADPISTCFYLPAPPGAKFFDPLTYNIEQFFATGKPPYPVERTLLTSTVLDLAMHSLKAGGAVRTDKALDIRYAAPKESGFFRGPYTDA